MIARLLVAFLITTAISGIVQAATNKPAPYVVWQLLRRLARRHRHTTARGRVPAAVLTADRTRRFDPRTALRHEARARAAAQQRPAVPPNAPAVLTSPTTSPGGIR